jgi:acyl dehydratase
MTALLDEIKKYIGIEAEPIEYVIEAGAVKLFADAIMDPDPLYYDEKFATTTKHRGIIAPPTFFGGATGLRSLKAGDSRAMSSINLPMPKGWTSVASGDEFQFFNPVRPGDILISREKLVGAYEKKRQNGNIIFVTREKSFIKKSGHPVLIRKMSSACIRQSHVKRPASQLNEPKDKGFESELPVLSIGPVMIRHLAMFAVATAEFVDIHYDRDYAQLLGLPNVIIQGLYKTTIIAQMLKNWSDDGRAIRSLAVQHRRMDVAGNTLTAGGRVIETTQQNNQRVTSCEVWTKNQYGQVTSVGTARLDARNKQV